MQFSLPLVPHLIAHWVLGMSDRFIIERYLGMGAVGIYASAYVFIDSVNLIAMSMNRAWVPLFTRAFGKKEERPFVAQSITYFVLAVTATTTMLTILSPTIVRLVYEGRYAPAADFASILAAGGFFQGIYYVYVAGLFYHRRNAVIPFITVAGGLTNIVLNIWWIPLLGLRGAALATLIGYIVLALGVRWGCNRITKLPFEKARLLKLALVSVVVTASGVLVDGLFTTWHDLIVKLAILIAGVLVLSLARFWNDEEIRWMKRIFGGRRR
jgi:O-antigen/teichoic acid export membrane protein